MTAMLVGLKIFSISNVTNILTELGVRV